MASSTTRWTASNPLSDLPSQARAWGELNESVMRDKAPQLPVFYDRTASLNGLGVGGLRLHDILGGTSLENAYVR
jgi:hypothetical protein